MTKPTKPLPLTGRFTPGFDGTFYGYIDVGNDRINCRLIPQIDVKVSAINLEEYELEVPIGTGKPFTLAKKK